MLLLISADRILRLLPIKSCKAPKLRNILTVVIKGVEKKKPGFVAEQKLTVLNRVSFFELKKPTVQVHCAVPVLL